MIIQSECFEICTEYFYKHFLDMVYISKYFDSFYQSLKPVFDTIFEYRLKPLKNKIDIKNEENQ
jgi:hypothetical protein